MIDDLANSVRKQKPPGDSPAVSEIEGTRHTPSKDKYLSPDERPHLSRGLLIWF